MDQTVAFWPVTAEGWSTLVANSIVIGTFVFGRRAFIEWTVSVRRALEALRFASPAGVTPPDIRIAHAHIQMERPSPDGRWHVKWTLPDGKEPRSAIAKVSSIRLRWHLARNPSTRDLLVFGEIRYLDVAEGAALSEIPTVDYITRGGMPKALARLLFG